MEYGDLDALLLALQMTRHSLVYLIDNEAVATVWQKRVWRERVPDGHIAPAGTRQWMDSWRAVAAWRSFATFAKGDVYRRLWAGTS